MILLLTALIALSNFNPLFPSLKDLQTKPKSEIVEMYSHACNEMLNPMGGTTGGLDMITIFQKTLESANRLSPNQSSGKSLKMDLVSSVFKKICTPNPDPASLNEFDGELKLAEDKYVEIQEGLPNIGDLRNFKLSQSTSLLATDGSTIAEIYGKNGRRRWVSITELPKYVPLTFVAVEDRRFFEHKGVDELGILRAVIKNSSSQGRPEGASTITQQVARNIFLNDKLSLERKISEMLLAGQIETQMLFLTGSPTAAKYRILELYLNLIYFGRNSWGIYKASEAYFGKTPNKLTVAETAYLVGLVQGPNLYQVKNARTVERMNFVLNKMVDEKVIPATAEISRMVEAFKITRETRFINSNYIRDYLTDAKGELATRQAKIPDGQFTLQTTINSKFQKTAEAALEEGLIAYEVAAGKYTWQGPITNIMPGISKGIAEYNKNKQLRDLIDSKMEDSLFSVGADDETKPEKIPNAVEKELPPWFAAFIRGARQVSVPVDTWQVGVVLENLANVGLADGTSGRLSRASLTWAQPLSYGDLIYVTQSGKSEYTIVQPPKINGGVIAMDVGTGDVLAMVGGFSYVLSKYNRAATAFRQPGSLVKPWTYMAALQLGYQPNLLLSNAPITFPPSSPGGQSWTPRNFENENSGGPRPMRWALEQSYNSMTARLMGMIGLSPIRFLAKEFGLYNDPINVFPFILGAQETTLLSAVKAYSAIANQGYVVPPHVATLSAGEVLPRQKISGVDDITLFQIRYLLQGVVQSGTARSMASQAQFVAGKTGTTQDLKDAWFVGFTPNVAIGVFVGYDTPETLGGKFAAANVALPIFDKILKSSYTFYKKAQAFAPPPPGVVIAPTDRSTGEIQAVMSKNTVSEAYRQSALDTKK